MNNEITVVELVCLAELTAEIKQKMLQVKTNLEHALDVRHIDRDYRITLINTYTIQAEIVQIYDECLKSPLAIGELGKSISENMQRSIVMLNRIVDTMEPLWQ